MKPLIRISLVIVSVCSSAWVAPAALFEVTAEGKAAGDVANAREQALTDALREAVRVGAGVDVVSTSDVRDFVLEYDRVFAASFGYVQNYSVLTSGVGSDGVYRVKIRAQIGEGAPEREEANALKMIVKLKQSPRVSLETDELMDGMPANSDFAKAWFESAARKMQMNLVDMRRLAREEETLAARDELFGDTRMAQLRRLALSQKTDFIIQAKVRGRFLGQESYYGGMPMRKFSVAADLRAVWADTGQVLVSVPMEGRELNSALESVDTAAREVVHRMLAGDAGSDYPGAWVLFRKIFVSWAAELDLGTVMRLEFNEMTEPEHDRLVRALGGTEKITGVWSREPDTKGLTYADVESRFDSTEMKTVVENILGNAYRFDHATRHFLQFRRTAGSQLSAARLQSPKELPGSAKAGSVKPETGSSGPSWAWTLVSTGSASILSGFRALIRRNR